MNLSKYTTRAAYNAYYTEYRKKNRKKVRKYHREYMRRVRKIKGYLAHTTRKKANARKMLRRYVANGKVIKGACEKCGEKRVHAHHSNYNYPLRVRWLCHLHHNQLHFKRKKGITSLLLKKRKYSQQWYLKNKKL